MAITLFLLLKAVAMKIILLVVLGIGNLHGNEFHSMLGTGFGTLIVYSFYRPCSPEIGRKLAEKQFLNRTGLRQWQVVYLLSLRNGSKNWVRVCTTND